MSHIKITTGKLANQTQPEHVQETQLWPKTCESNTTGVWLPAALRAAQICRYLVYSEADFEVLRPAGATRCTDGGEIWHGGGEQARRRGPAWRRGPWTTPPWLVA